MTFPELLLSVHRPSRNIWRNFDTFREKIRPNPNVFVDSSEVIKKGAWIFAPGNDPYWEMGFADHPLLFQAVNKPSVMRSVLLTMALGAWRPTQDVIRFDDAIYDALVESDMGEGIPVDILGHFPAWSLWFDTPRGFEERHSDGRVTNWKGFFVTTDGNGDRLTFIFADDDMDGGGNITCKCAYLQFGDEVVSPTEKIRKAYGAKVNAEEVRTGKDFTDPNLLKAISLLTYVCAHGFEDRPGALARSISRPGAKKTKQGWRIFPAPKASVRNLGSALSERLAKAVSMRENRENSEPGGTVRPHMRRAHWHGYWMGPKKDGQYFDVRWLPPILVAAKDEDELSVAPKL